VVAVRQSPRRRDASAGRGHERPARLGSLLLSLDPFADRAFSGVKLPANPEGWDLALTDRMIDPAEARIPHALLRPVEERRYCLRTNEHVVGQSFIVRAQGARCFGVHFATY